MEIWCSLTCPNLGNQILPHKKNAICFSSLFSSVATELAEMDNTLGWAETINHKPETVGDGIWKLGIITK